MDQKEDLRKVDDREFIIGFLLHKLTQELSFEEDIKSRIKSRLEKDKMADLTVSIKGPTGIKLKGTIIIKEEE